MAASQPASGLPACCYGGHRVADAMLLKVATALLAVAAVSLFLLQLASTEAASALLVAAVGVDTDTTGWPARITVAVVVTVATSVWLCCLWEPGEDPVERESETEDADEAH